VETFAALRLRIDTWRWAGVPFHIRAGKRLAATATEVRVELRAPPQVLFDAGAPNYFRFRLGPDVLIATGASTKAPGETMAGRPVELIVHGNAAEAMQPYERLLGDALLGDGSLFTRDDCVEAAWRVVEPILQDPSPPIEYAAGTLGPTEADQVVAGAGGWHNPAPAGERDAARH
jgi:glucose-6-phosphate 1-dehydrogenase